jgi:predicted component of type VI protein secretion system
VDAVCCDNSASAASFAAALFCLIVPMPAVPELVFDVAALDYVFPALPRTCAIGPGGGTLGRDERNTLVLPDRYQRVSRLHAEITFVRGVPILSNRSRTLVVTVGDQEVLPGDSAIVQDDDVVEVGPYLLTARLRDGQAHGVAATPAAPADPPPRTVTVEALTLALAQGAGVPDDTFAGGLDVERAERIGATLRHAVQGAMDLLSAGAITQREIRVSTQLVAEQSNNPLRFLPTAEAALVQLLTGQLPGFMHGIQALPDAFADLRAHDAGVMAGMHAALADMLVRLDPRTVDASLVASPELAAIIAPSAEKARWWDTQNDIYSRVLAEAEDNFEETWGRAFVDAYSNAASRMRTQACGAEAAVLPEPTIRTLEATCLAS